MLFGRAKIRFRLRENSPQRRADLVLDVGLEGGVGGWLVELLIGLRGGEEARRAQKVRAAELGGSLNHWNVWGAARGGPHRADRGQQDRRGGQGEGEAAADHSLYYQCAVCAADFLQTKALQLVFWWFNGIAQLDQAPASAAGESGEWVVGRLWQNSPDSD